MDFDLSIFDFALYILRQCRNGLQRLQGACLTIVRKYSNRPFHLADDVGKLTRRMQRKVTGAGAGVEFGKGRGVGCERPVRTIEFVNEKLIESEIVDHGETVGGREMDGGGGWPFWAL